MPNVNEMHRQMMEERDYLLDELFANRLLGKSDKESMLRRVRQLERELDIEGNNYNSSEFGK